MTEFDITLRLEKQEHRNRPIPVWVAETEGYPTCSAPSLDDCLDDLGAMIRQGAKGESDYDRGIE